MTKEEIKSRYSMRDILQRCGLPQPNRAGFIKCPFHKEKTASMKIYEDSYYCFGCGESGDIFTMVQRMEGLTFRGAFEALGGGSENNFSTRLKIYQAQKKREMQRKAEAELKRKRENNLFLIDIYRTWLGHLRPLSDAWAETYNALQYQEYLWEILNDPEECYGTIRRLEQRRTSVR